ncbi:hypothetical protein AZE42_05133 [Rhizopogon vesiculosus]|uniref:Uncharacterized protein n=1 Tax=Rhizopogon vesiculosus TaxID=180088 RepID=A0A1J8QLB5_9AGAM|nr:hypothetical protein AZE42_05133 [Rhizopogon vesiculosus]
MPGHGSMHMQAQQPFVSAVSYAPTAQPTTWRRARFPVSTQAISMPPIQPTAEAPIVQPRTIPQATPGAPPLPVFAQATSTFPDQPVTQVLRAEPRTVPQSASGGPPLPVIAQDFFTMGPSRQPQHTSGVLPPVVAGDINISPDVTEDDEMDDLFKSPEISTSLALPPAHTVEETTPDAPVAQTAPADAPAPFSFDLAALDLPFDNWMDNGEQSLDDALADAFADVFGDPDS